MTTRVAGFWLTAGVLAFVCRQGTSLAVVAVVFVVFVAAATLWVRGQYEAALDAERPLTKTRRPWTLQYRYSVPAFILGLGSAALGHVIGNGYLLVVGVLVAYLAIGYVVMRLRIEGIVLRPVRNGPLSRIRRNAGTSKPFKRVPGARPGSAAGPATPATREGTTRAAAGRGVAFAFLALISAAGFGLGLAGLESQPKWVIALIVGALVSPMWMAVAAEVAIERLQENQRRGHRNGPYKTFGAGFVLLVVTLVAVASKSTEQFPSRWLVIAFAALAVLVIAIAASSQADVAAMIAVICLMGVTPMSEERPDDLTAVEPAEEETVLVVLGDSYMSGEGADVYFREDADNDNSDDGGENRCHRAPTAWAALAGQTDRLFDRGLIFACSGATTRNVRFDTDQDGDDTEYAQFNEPGTQLDQAKKYTTDLGDDDLVVLNLGGNDAGFSTIGAMCLAPGNCADEKKRWMDSLPQVSAALTRAYKDVRTQFPDTPVLVTAYPDPLYSTDEAYTARCDDVALSPDERTFVGEFLRALNITVGRAALAEQFYFLHESEQALANAHLQLCDPENDGRPGLNFIGLRSVGGVAEHRFNPKNWYHNSLHPNARGHAAILQEFESWRALHNPEIDRDRDGQPDGVAKDNQHAAAEAADLARTSADLNLDNARVPAAASASTPAAGSGPIDQCDLFLGDTNTIDTKGRGCRDGGARWARGQIVDLLVGWWGVLILVTVAASWLLAVGFYGWRRPWWPTPRPGRSAYGETPQRPGPQI